MLNKYDIAEKFAIEFAGEETDGKFAIEHRMLAKRQKELFGYNVFNRKGVSFYFDKYKLDYVISISKKVCFGLDGIGITLTCEEFAELVNNKTVITDEKLG